MAKLTEKNILDYRLGGDKLSDFALKYMAEIPRIYQFLNNLRTHDSNGTEQVEPEPYQIKVEDDKFYVRNKANDAWLYLFDVAKNGGMRSDSFGRQSAGSISSRPQVGNTSGDVYWDTDNGRVYMWQSDAWHLILSLHIDDLIGHDDVLTKSDLSVPETGALATTPNKLVPLNANGVLPVNVSGNAGQLAGVNVQINKLQDGQVLTFRTASNVWRNEDKGVVGAGKALAIKDGDTLLAEFSGDEAVDFDTERTAHENNEDAHAKAFAKHNTSEDAHANIFEKVQSIAAAHMYNFYYRSGQFRTDTATRTALVSPAYILVNVGGNGYESKAAITLDISKDAAWDTAAQEWQASHAYAVGDVVYPTSGHTTYYYRCITAGTSSTLTPSFPTTLGSTYNDGNVVWECQLDYTQAVNRKGKDFYVYACADGDALKLVVSPNSTVPTKYTADSSRKIGGFHCLCADVGTISGHALSGYVAGDILPASVWDLKFRATSENEGMVWDGSQWVDIYLDSWNGSSLVSAYVGVVADGYSTKPFHGELFVEEFAKVKKHLISRDQYVAFAKGSNEKTNIKGSADANTTGGHVDTAGRRMISNIGCEDCCGWMWQWTSDISGHPNASASNSDMPGDGGQTSSSEGDHWLHGYEWQDDGRSVANINVDGSTNIYGHSYGALSRAIVGGGWVDGSSCGSRSVNMTLLSSNRADDRAGRGASEPRAAIL